MSQQATETATLPAHHQQLFGALRDAKRGGSYTTVNPRGYAVRALRCLYRAAMGGVDCTELWNAIAELENALSEPDPDACQFCCRCAMDTIRTLIALEVGPDQIE